MTKSAERLGPHDYPGFVRDYLYMKPYSRKPNGTYPEHVNCVLCHIQTAHKVFFPCQHKCVCDGCLTSHQFTTLYEAHQASFQDSWFSCPVCIADIMLILPHTGKEEQEYWRWVNEVKPPLPLDFAQEFKQAAKQLRKIASKHEKSMIKNQQRSSTCIIS